MQFFAIIVSKVHKIKRMSAERPLTHNQINDQLANQEWPAMAEQSDMHNPAEQREPEVPVVSADKDTDDHFDEEPESSAEVQGEEREEQERMVGAIMEEMLRSSEMLKQQMADNENMHKRLFSISDELLLNARTIANTLNNGYSIDNRELRSVAEELALQAATAARLSAERKDEEHLGVMRLSVKLEEAEAEARKRVDDAHLEKLASLLKPAEETIEQLAAVTRQSSDLSQDIKQVLSQLVRQLNDLAYDNHGQAYYAPVISKCANDLENVLQESRRRSLLASELLDTFNRQLLHKA